MKNSYSEQLHNVNETRSSAEPSVLDRKELQADQASNKIITVPNVISLFRIAIIPLIIYAYVYLHSYVTYIILLAVSAFSDIIDGFIARKFKQTSEFGKLIDPVADKLTQGALMLCLLFKFRFFIFLIISFLAREVAMIIMGTMLKYKTERFSSAKWYGKANTVIVEGSVLFLIVFGFIPDPALTIIAKILVSVSIVSVFVSLLLYVIYYIGIFKKIKTKSG